MDVRIRDEAPGDAPAIRRLLTEAFGGPDEADLVGTLRAEGDVAFALVAEDAEGVLGHVLFSPLQAPFPALALAPLAVSPGRQRQGVGARLTRAGLARAAAGEWRAVVVLGDPDYYGRFGFDPALAAGFDSPYAGPHLMALALNGPLPARSGALGHARAFGAG